MSDPTTTAAIAILETFTRDAERRAPHCAIEHLLTIAERMERDQGGRLTEFQARVLAAFLLGASRLPEDVTDAEIVPEWLTPEDAERYAAGEALVPQDARSSSLTAH